MNWAIMLLSVLDPARAGTIGLTMFVMIFAGVTVWALTRSRGQIRHWSNLPLDATSLEEGEPVHRLEEAKL